MAAELAGVVELGKWSTLDDGSEALIRPTKDIRRFRLTIKPKVARVSTVKHRRHQGRKLTDGPQTM